MALTADRRSARFGLWASIILLGLLGVQSASASQSAHVVWPRDIVVELRFGETPLVAEIASLDCEALTQGNSCQTKLAARNHVIRFSRPGRYRLFASHDANLANPAHFPGDYEGQLELDVDAKTSQILLPLARLMHVTAPVDNSGPVKGMLGGDCLNKPRVTTPSWSWPAQADVDFAWDASRDGTRYAVRVFRLQCQPFAFKGMVAEIFSEGGQESVRLPVNADDEFYLARIEGYRNAVLVADLWTHDAGAHSFNLRFRVIDGGVPRWTMAALGLAVLVLLVAAAQGLLGRSGRYTTFLCLLLLLTLVAVWCLRRQQEVEAARSQAVQASAQALVRHMAEQAWRRIALPPADTPDGAHYDTDGALLAAWQGGGAAATAASIKARYYRDFHRALLAHASDVELVMTAVDLMFHFRPPDPGHWRLLAQEALKKHADHRRRLDNCAECAAADTVASITASLGRTYLDENKPTQAIQLAVDLLQRRHNDISPYGRVGLHLLHASGQRYAGRYEAAIEVVDRGLADVGETPYAQSLRDLRKLLMQEHSQREAAKPSS